MSTNTHGNASHTSPQIDSLSSLERNTLLAVMESKDQLEPAIQEPIMGNLLKWTNVVKGWQLRYFLLSPETGMLHYYLSEDRVTEGVPRGTLQLHSAIVQPSEGDQCMFAIFPNTGDPYRLRAANVKERHLWMERIRQVVYKHTSDFKNMVKAVKTMQTSTSSAAKTTTESPPDLTKHTSEPADTKTVESPDDNTNSSEDSIESDSGVGTSTRRELLDMHVLLHSLNTSHTYHNEILHYCNSSPHFAHPSVLNYKCISASLFKLLDETYVILNKLKIEDAS